MRACWPLEARNLISELYGILSNKFENPRTHSGFRDHRYFHAWAAGRARIATRLFLRAQPSAAAPQNPACPESAEKIQPNPLSPFPYPQRLERSGKRKRPGSRAHAPGDVPTLGEQPEAGSQGRQLPSRGPGVETSFTGVSPPQQTAMTPKPAGPPDGGWGWVVAAAAFAVNGLSYGLLRSLGLALPDLAEHFERSAQDTAWVSALALAVQQAASPVGSALSTRWGARPVVMVGGVLTSLGLVFSAFARSLLHLYLGLGLLAGSGWALVFAPALGTLSRYFSRRRVLAVGLALTGFLRDKTGDFSASFLVCSSFILSGSFIYMGLPRALPSCRPASPPATPPPERGELLPVPQVSLLSTGGSSSIRDTTC
ncbi:monocarboxylate transporter 11 isoform X8 [Rattus norvegicus]|uniref:monocarboxylate transporter 11 isoform X8 n=1 Tax=Rattus norvegicus TaxID=10116 RepID=UPI001917723C|nr:monocarboxylate transporter 11 isoform X7 [Rattus norvegicus]